MFHNHWTVGQIKSEYRKLAKLHHPDLGGDLEKMKQVNLAYHTALLAANGETTTGSSAYCPVKRPEPLYVSAHWTSCSTLAG